MRRVPTQTATVEPNTEVLERAKTMYRENDPDLDREEYIRRVVVESIRINVDLEGANCEP
jgi:hypothetical protein